MTLHIRQWFSSCLAFMWLVFIIRIWQSAIISKDFFKVRISANFSVLYSCNSAHISSISSSIFLLVTFDFSFLCLCLCLCCFLIDWTNFNFIVIYIETCICIRWRGIGTAFIDLCLKCLFFILDVFHYHTNMLMKRNSFAIIII